MMRTIGAISDTHGLLWPQALAALAGCDPIIHAGDVGSPDVLARLGALAPVHAVRGNVDHGAWSANLPVTQRIEIDGFRIYVLHILASAKTLFPEDGVTKHATDFEMMTGMSLENYRMPARTRNPRRGRPVRCCSIGKIFRS